MDGPIGRGRGRGGDRRGPGRPCWISNASTLAVAYAFIVFGGREFVIVIKDDPLGIQRLPDKFGKFVTGKETATLQLQLREAGCGFFRWPVDVLFNGRGKMYLHKGWEEFARVHNLEAGCMLTFLYKGDEEMSMKVFDDTSCRWHHHSEDGEEED